MAKLFFYDLETTGLDHNRNGIHQISGIVEIDGVVKSEFSFHSGLFGQDQIDPKALEVAGVTRSDIEKYPPADQVYKALIKTIGTYINRFDKQDKLHLVGFNNRGLDDAFFRKFFAKNLDKYFGAYFWSDSIDVMVLASNHLRDQRPLLQDFKLSTVAAYLGIEVEESRLHDATYDVELTHNIYKLLNKK